MKVQFDSNTYRRAFMPEESIGKRDYEDCLKIYKAILNGIITPFLSETIFTLEAVEKHSRLDVSRNQKISLTTQEETGDNNEITITLKIGPDPSIFPGIHPKHLKYVEAARSIGARTLRFPRLAGLTNSEVEDLLYRGEENEDTIMYSEMFAANEVIESLGSGLTAIKQLLKSLDIEDRGSFIENAQAVPDASWKRFGKAVAEWSDGDSIAVAIGYKMDFLCTDDKAKSAGSKSIFSATNLKIIQDKFPNFRVCTLSDLARQL